MSRRMDEVGDAAKDCDTARCFHTPPKLRQEAFGDRGVIRRPGVSGTGAGSSAARPFQRRLSGRHLAKVCRAVRAEICH